MLGPNWNPFSATTPEEKVSPPIGLPGETVVEETAVEVPTTNTAWMQSGVGFAVLGLAVFGIYTLWSNR